jgi:hypothetical protein
MQVMNPMITKHKVFIFFFAIVGLFLLLFFLLVFPDLFNSAEKQALIVARNASQIRHVFLPVEKYGQQVEINNTIEKNGHVFSLKTIYFGDDSTCVLDSVKTPFRDEPSPFSERLQAVFTKDIRYISESKRLARINIVDNLEKKYSPLAFAIASNSVNAGAYLTCFEPVNRQAEYLTVTIGDATDDMNNAQFTVDLSTVR